MKNINGQNELAALHEDVKYHSETAALYDKYAACQDDDIAAAERCIRDAEDRLRSARAKKADWLRRAAISREDIAAAAHLLNELTNQADWLRRAEVEGRVS